MAAPERLNLCPSANLVEGGPGLRFEVAGQAAFAVRYQGTVRAYLNACRHIPVELDLSDGRFFDLSGHYLVCSMHGALYAADTGVCVSGPCRGARLMPVGVTEEDGSVWLLSVPAGN